MDAIALIFFSCFPIMLLNLMRWSESRVSVFRSHRTNGKALCFCFLFFFKNTFQSVFLNSRVIIPKTVIFIGLCSAFLWSMNANCLIPGDVQKQVKRHNCKIQVTFPYRRGAWEILSHPISWPAAVVWDTVSRSPLQSTAWDPVVEEGWFLTVGQESWPQLEQEIFFFFPLLFLIHFHFKE